MSSAKRKFRRLLWIIGGMICLLGFAVMALYFKDPFEPIGNLEQDVSFGKYRVRTYFVRDLEQYFQRGRPWFERVNVLSRAVSRLPDAIKSKLYPDTEGLGSIEIFKGRKRIYGQHSYFYEVSGLVAGTNSWPFIGQDINGDKLPDLVVHEYSSRTFCVTHVFELSDPLRELAVIRCGRDEPVFRDFDGDGKMEIELKDPIYDDFWPGIGWFKTPPRVILHWEKGAYVPAIDLMKKPPPSEEEYQNKIAKILAPKNRLPSESEKFDHIMDLMDLFGEALDLMYTGHEDLGWRLIRDAWPPSVPADEDLLKAWRDWMEESSYWPQLKGAWSPNQKPQ